MTRYTPCWFGEFARTRSSPSHSDDMMETMREQCGRSGSVLSSVFYRLPVAVFGDGGHKVAAWATHDTVCDISYIHTLYNHTSYIIHHTSHTIHHTSYIIVYNSQYRCSKRIPIYTTHSLHLIIQSRPLLRSSPFSIQFDCLQRLLRRCNAATAMLPGRQLNRPREFV